MAAPVSDAADEARAAGMPGHHLPVSPSLNRAVIGHWPGLPADVAGSEAHDWLTVWSIARCMSRRDGIIEVIRAGGVSPFVLPALPAVEGVTVELMEAAVAWPQALDTLVAAGVGEAEALADDLGQVLGALVATLVSGPEDARRARPDWPAQRWAQWGAVRRVALGGGVMSGRLGERMLASAQDLLDRHEVEVLLHLGHPAQRLALSGAASLLPEVGGVALDCGGTSIKWGMDGAVPAPGRVSAADVLAVIADAVTAALAGGHRHTGASAVVMSIATYVDEAGQPFAGQLGPYAPLGEIAFVPALVGAVRLRSGCDIAVQVIHDGRAALLGARLERPDTDAAIVLGTAIGSGLDPLALGPMRDAGPAGVRYAAESG